MGTAGPSPEAGTEPPHSPLLVPAETSGQLANDIGFVVIVVVILL